MAVGPSSYLIGKWFDVSFRGAALTATTSWLKLHTAEPGAAGATAPATYTTRQAVTFGAATTAAGATTIANTAQVQITNITATGTEDATHYSLWDAVSAGNFLGSGVINANAFVTGDTLTFAVGAISLAFNVAT